MHIAASPPAGATPAILPCSMAASRSKISVAVRTEFGSRTSRRLRRGGQVPGVVYTSGEAARPFQADARELTKFLGEGHALFDLEIAGSKAVPVVIKEVQTHPVRDELIHLDCLQVDLAQEIEADVDIDLEGAEASPGVKAGGILEHVLRQVTIEALPAAIPDYIVVDVSAMEIGETIQLDAVPLPDGVTFAVDAPEEFTVATLNPPRVVEEETEVEEETAIVGEEPAEEGAADGDGGDSGDSEG